MMSRNKMYIAGAVLLVLAAVGAYLVYDWVLGDTLAPSAPITAIPLAEQPEAEAPSGGESTLEAPAALPASGAAVFQINQSESEVRFKIDEELRGQPTLVIGVSNQVAGEIAIDPSDLSTVQLGVIQVNARTLATDNDRRNQAIRNVILQTDLYEFVTFAPTAITGLSGSGASGQSYSFEISGNLTIRDITKPAVFTVTVTAESNTRLRGSATTTVLRADYNLTIPDVPFVANVSEEVILEIDFVALAASQ